MYYPSSGRTRTQPCLILKSSSAPTAGAASSPTTLPSPMCASPPRPSPPTFTPRKTPPRALHRLRHALRVQSLCPRLRRGGGRHRHSGAAGQRITPTPALSYGVRERGMRRRHHDYLLAQSGAVERRQVQGLVRRLGQALDHRRDRVLPGPARARARAARADREVDFLPPTSRPSRALPAWTRSPSRA
jgi:hypothetical protein